MVIRIGFLFCYTTNVILLWKNLLWVVTASKKEESHATDKSYIVRIVVAL